MFPSACLLFARHLFNTQFIHCPLRSVLSIVLVIFVRALASDRHCLLQGWCQVISWLIYNNCLYDILKSFWKLFQLPGFKTMNLRFTLQKIHVF